MLNNMELPPSVEAKLDEISIKMKIAHSVILSWYEHFNFKWNYHRCWTAFLIGVSLIGAFIMSAVDHMSFTNGFFQTISAISGTGLSTVSMRNLSIPSFVTLAFVMLAGDACFLLLPALAYRRYAYRELRSRILSTDRDIGIQHEFLYGAVGVLMWSTVAYFIINHIIPTFLLWWALSLYPLEPELAARGYNNFYNALYTTISAHANAGFTLSSSNLFYLKNNPFAYFIISYVILAGNTCIPIFMYYQLKFMRWYSKNMMKGDSTWVYLDFILAHPRRVCGHIYSKKETDFLLRTVILLHCIQFACYLASSYGRPSVQQYGNFATIAGMGFFQTISTRCAGFQIMDLKTMNQGMLVVYVMMMYLFTAPFVRSLYLKEEMVGDGSVDASYIQKVYELNYDEEKPRRNSVDSTLEKAPVDNGFLGEFELFEGMEISFSQPGILKFIFGDDNTVFSKFFKSFVFRHSFFLLLSIFLISFSEDRILTDQTALVNLWYFLFEVVSAYGNVGISVGYPGKPYSLIGVMSDFAKWVLILIMLLGKHRCMPSADDEIIDFQFKKLSAVSVIKPPDTKTFSIVKFFEWILDIFGLHSWVMKKTYNLSRLDKKKDQDEEEEVEMGTVAPASKANLPSRGSGVFEPISPTLARAQTFVLNPLMAGHRLAPLREDEEVFEPDSAAVNNVRARSATSRASMSPRSNSVAYSPAPMHELDVLWEPEGSDVVERYNPL